MSISVQNITATSALVSWPSPRGCLDAFYSIMYHPNWNSLLMGHTRKSFLREDRVPVTQTTTFLGNLSPQTTYVLCVTCRSAAKPAQEQCQVFNTLDRGPEMGSQQDLAMGVWLASSLLLLVIAMVLLWGCLHSMCPGQGLDRGQGQSRPPEEGSHCPATCPSRLGQTLVPGAGGAAARDGWGVKDSSLYTPSSSEDEEEEQVEKKDDKLAKVLDNSLYVGNKMDSQSPGLLERPPEQTSETPQ